MEEQILDPISQQKCIKRSIKQEADKLNREAEGGDHRHRAYEEYATEWTKESEPHGDTKHEEASFGQQRKIWAGN